MRLPVDSEMMGDLLVIFVLFCLYLLCHDLGPSFGVIIEMEL